LQLRKEYFEEIAKGKTPKEAVNSLTYKVYKGGILAV
jgi:hypothetical protein